MPRNTSLVAVALALFLTLPAVAQRRRLVVPPSLPPETIAVSGLTVSVVARPRPVAAHGVGVMAWELLIRNNRASDFTLTRVDVSAAGEPLLTYDGATLRSIIQNVPTRGSSPPADVIRTGEWAILYLWLTVRTPSAAPVRLDHRLLLTTSSGNEEIAGPGAIVTPETRAPIAAPVLGGQWLAANGPANDSLHRRAAGIFDDRVLIAQRYAIDFLLLGPGGSSFSGDPTRNASYFAYGRDLLAVAAATVVSLQDGIAENVPQQLPPFSVATAPGNYVILDLGDGRFVLYAHLQPGSLRVALGDRVTRGQVLGKIGNSGNSTEPHLHFHVCDTNSALICDGHPFVFERFLTPDGGRLAEIPLRNDLVTFEN